MESSDANLVAVSLTGNRDAFGQIVARYQNLICSLAYSGTGSLHQSQDLAQETFITAWKQLSKLREPHKLRSWLCGIARHHIYDALKSEGREPSHKAEPLEKIYESHSPEPLPLESTINNEEAAILWRALEKIPEIYRDPLILFYREHQSIEAVSQNLELSEDAVKQRLSRGRKLLHEQVLAFIEDALERTNPGKVFTLGVLAALPSLTISAKAATIGAAAIKGSATAKASALGGLFGAMFSPLLVVFGNYASYRTSLDEAHSDEERGNIKTLFKKSLFIGLIISAVLAVPLFFALRDKANFSLFWSLLFCQTIVVYFLTIFAFAAAAMSTRRRYLARLLTEKYRGNFPPAAYEYRSRSILLGLPLVHVRLGDRFDVLRGPVKAWIAVGGNHAVGVIFASGRIAIAPLSFGGIAIGVLPFGAIALGIFSLGAITLGIWCYGGLAIGWRVFCGCGVAWNAAMGGLAFARDFAAGGVAYAKEANSEGAKQFFQHNLFFQCASAVSRHNLWIILAGVLPAMLQSRLMARARRFREQKVS